MAQCPIHEDSTPSLSITERNGRLLMYCFGCRASFTSILAALDLSSGAHDLNANPQPAPPPEPEEEFDLAKAVRVIESIPDPVDDPFHPANMWADHFNIVGADSSWPSSIRWNPGWPPQSAGSIIAPQARLENYSHQGVVFRKHITGIQRIHINEDGTPAEDRDGLNKRSHGDCADNGTLIGSIEDLAEIAVVEGIKDALALHWYLHMPVFAMCGTAFSPVVAENLAFLTRWPHELKRIQLWPDNDSNGAGAEAIGYFRGLLAVEGVDRDKIAVAKYTPGRDPAEWVAAERKS